MFHKYKAARERLTAAQARNDAREADDAKNEMSALAQFKKDMTTYQRLYTFLSQIVDYGNTALEKRFLFYKRLVPLLEFGREREGIDVSKLVLTHHALKSQGKRALPLGGGGTELISALISPGGGSIQEKEKALLSEIISKVNELFEGDLTENDEVAYINTLKSKLLESPMLAQQAAHNTKEQFDSSPDLSRELMSAIIAAFDAHTSMSKQAIGSERVQTGLRDILLGPAQLYEALRERYGLGGRSV